MTAAIMNDQAPVSPHQVGGASGRVAGLVESPKRFEIAQLSSTRTTACAFFSLGL
jgi:hypothetical protein